MRGMNGLTISRNLRFAAIAAAAVASLLLASVGRELSFNGLEIAVLASLLGTAAYTERS